MICTELHRQGFMGDRTYTLDARFGHTMPADVLRGYHLWAKPLVRVMRRSQRVTRLVAYLAGPWVTEMVYVMGARPTGSWRGRALMAVGVPICQALGRAARRGLIPCAR